MNDNPGERESCFSKWERVIKSTKIDKQQPEQLDRDHLADLIDERDGALSQLAAKDAEIAALRPVAELLVALPTWTGQTTNELRDNYQRAQNIARAALEMSGAVK
jgi:hypothetical protein